MSPCWLSDPEHTSGVLALPSLSAAHICTPSSSISKSQLPAPSPAVEGMALRLRLYRRKMGESVLADGVRPKKPWKTCRLTVGSSMRAMVEACETASEPSQRKPGPPTPASYAFSMKRDASYPPAKMTITVAPDARNASVCSLKSLSSFAPPVMETLARVTMPSALARRLNASMPDAPYASVEATVAIRL